MKELGAVAARFRPRGNPGGVEEATRFALRSVARRYQTLSEEIAELEAQLDRPVAESAAELTSLPAIGTDHAATLLMVAGGRPPEVEQRGVVRQHLRSVTCGSLLRQSGGPSSQPGRQPRR